jgi:hypothetical protein
MKLTRQRGVDDGSICRPRSNSQNVGGSQTGHAVLFAAQSPPGLLARVVLIAPAEPLRMCPRTVPLATSRPALSGHVLVVGVGVTQEGVQHAAGVIAPRAIVQHPAPWGDRPAQQSPSVSVRQAGPITNRDLAVAVPGGLPRPQPTPMWRRDFIHPRPELGFLHQRRCAPSGKTSDATEAPLAFANTGCGSDKHCTALRAEGAHAARWQRDMIVLQGESPFVVPRSGRWPSRPSFCVPYYTQSARMVA